MKTLERYVDETTFRMNEEELKKTYLHGCIGIHYAFNNYRSDVNHILELRDEVLKDYPNMSADEMEVRIIGRHESTRHAGVTTLFVGIPIDDYLKLYKEDKIGIL